MNYNKNQMGFWLISSLLCFFFIGGLVSQEIERDTNKKQFEEIYLALHEAKMNPDKNLDYFFELLEEKRYAKFAYANVMGLMLADIYRPEKSGVVYTHAMHIMNEENTRYFIESTYNRLLERDREDYENHSFEFPESVKQDISYMFSNRPYFMFSPKETLAIRDCLGLDDIVLESSKSAEMKYETDTNRTIGCKPLMEMYNNINL